MRFSSALATAVLSFVSLTSADNIGVATVYRYINSTATVYANYCPCAATTTLTGLAAGTSTPQAPVVNNNAGSNNIPATAGNTGSNTGSTAAQPAGGNTGSTVGAPASPAGGSTGAQPNGQAPGSTYVTVVVQYQTSVVYSTFATTITLGPQQTITSVVTNTLTATVPVTITSTVTVPNNGAGVDPNANSRLSSASAPYGNTTRPALTSSTVTSLGSSVLTSSTASALTSTTNSAGSGVDAGQNTLGASSSTTASVVPTTTSDLPSLSLDATTSTAAAGVTTTSDVLSTTSNAAPTTSSTTAAVPTTTTTTTATSSTEAPSTSAPAPTSTVNVYFRTTAQSTPNNTYYNNIYINNAAPILYDNGGSDPVPQTTSNAPFVFFVVTPGGTRIVSTQATADNAETFLAYASDAASLATGTPVVWTDAAQQPAGTTDTGFSVTGSGASISITATAASGISFYINTNRQLSVTTSTGEPADAFIDAGGNFLPLNSFLLADSTPATSADPPVLATN